MKKKPKSEKYEKDTYLDRGKIEDEILVDELKKILKEEIIEEGLILLAMYVIFMDCDF